MATNQKGKILLVPIGSLEEKLLQDMVDPLERIFGRKVEIHKPYPLPESAYNPDRHQYHSSRILDRLLDIPKGPHDRVLGIVDVDLYVPELNFVFGEADWLSRVAVISVVRLRQSYYGYEEDPEIFLKRVLTEAVHELGHTFGLRHCSNPHCVMYFSNTILDTDRKGYEFCPKCRAKLP